MPMLLLLTCALSQNAGFVILDFKGIVQDRKELERAAVPALLQKDRKNIKKRVLEIHPKKRKTVAEETGEVLC
jgi:hypothetical protein